MITQEQMHEAMEHIAGTCTMCPEQAVEAIIGRELSDEEIVEFELFLQDNECYECDNCGWFTYPTEGCDCVEDEDNVGN